MAADPDNMGASFCALFLIKQTKMTVSKADEILKERRISTKIIQNLLDYLNNYRQKSGIERNEFQKNKK